MSEQKRYEKISEDILKHIGGKENIVGATHCATRLRIVVKDQSKIDIDELENVDLAKGSFIAGDQLQIIFGTGLVNSVYKVFTKVANISEMSKSDVKSLAASKQNPIQAVIKALSDVFVEIIPAILASAILLGITGFIGGQQWVKANESLYAIVKIASLASEAAFAYLPLLVVYSATKRFGGRPVLGIVVGGVMLLPSLANAYSIGSENFNPETIKLFGYSIQLIGFQGGVLIALMMGWITAKLDQFFEKVIPNVVKLIFAPVLTVLISTLLLFTIVGPLGRSLSDFITLGLVTITRQTGVFGYMLFAGVQQLIVITGLHHILNAVEAQLIATTGANFLNPLMSVALIAQGGAVLGWLLLNWKNLKAREIAIPSFTSILFGISEPAIFGINLRYTFPLIGGCIAAALTGAYVWLVDLKSIGYGATAIPGFFIVSPNNNGYFHYVVAHIMALVLAIIFTVILSSLISKKDEKKVTTENVVEKDAVKLYSVAKGEVKPISESTDPTFASKVMGDGYLVNPSEETIVAPADATVEFVYPSKHAIGLLLSDGSKLLIHAGIDTVQLNGEAFEVFVKEGDKVKQGQRLLTMNLEKVKQAGYSTQTMVIVAELGENRSVTITPDQEVVAVIA